MSPGITSRLKDIQKHSETTRSYQQQGRVLKPKTQELSPKVKIRLASGPRTDQEEGGREGFMPSLGREQAAPPQTEAGFRAGDSPSTVPGQSSSRRILIKGSLAGVDEDQKQGLRSTLQNKKQDYIRENTLPGPKETQKPSWLTTDTPPCPTTIPPSLPLAWSPNSLVGSGVLESRNSRVLSICRETESNGSSISFSLVSTVGYGGTEGMYLEAFPQTAVFEACD